MTWLQILLGILSEAPQLISDVEALINTIMGKTVVEQAAAKQTLSEAVATRDAVQIKSAINDLK